MQLRGLGRKRFESMNDFTRIGLQYKRFFGYRWRADGPGVAIYGT